MNPLFGQKITVTQKFVRKSIAINGAATNKQWEVQEIKEKEALIIGKRTLFNGITHWEDNYCWFEFKKPMQALLVVENMNKKPFFIPIQK
jgi:hypothetical protein